MSVEKTEDVRAPPQEVPPYEYNANYHPHPIEPDHAQPTYTETFAAQPVQQLQPALPQNNYPTAVPLYALQRTPACVDCPSCGQREMTRVEFVSGSTTHGCAALLCLCFCLGCIPYMMSSMKDTRHFCGKCSTLLVNWHSSGRAEIVAGPDATKKR